MSIYRAPYQGILLKLGRCERLSLLMMKRYLMRNYRFFNFKDRFF